MYLSKLIINHRNPQALRFFLNPYEAHRTIWSGFPNGENGGPGRPLFRLEYRKITPYLIALVQSNLEPNWQPLLHKRILYGAETKELKSALLQEMTKVNQRLRFRLRANPTARKIVNEDVRDKNGRPLRKRVGLFGEEQQIEWLRSKAEKSGFKLLDCRISARVNSDCKKEGSNGKIRHLGVLFDGILEITEQEVFLKTLESGIGSAKGFGFGLLSLARI